MKTTKLKIIKTIEVLPTKHLMPFIGSIEKEAKHPQVRDHWTREGQIHFVTTSCKVTIVKA